MLRATADYAAACRYYEQALAIYRKVHGEQNPLTATTLNNLGVLLQAMGEYAGARTYYEQALAIRKKVFGDQHSVAAHSLHNLGTLMQATGDYGASRTYYEETLAVWKKVHGGQHPHTATTLNNLSLLLLQKGDATGAVVCFDEARRGIRGHVARVLPGLSPAEQLMLLTNTEEADLHMALSLGRLNHVDAAIAALSAGWLLNGKAVAHEALAQRTLLARESNNPTAAAVLQELQSVRSRLARQSLKAVTPDQQEAHRKQLAELEAAADRLTRRLGQLGIDAKLPDPWVELDDVRSRIPAGAVLIDIACFQPFDFTNRKRQPARYVVWIIPPAGVRLNTRSAAIDPLPQGDTRTVHLGVTLEKSATEGEVPLLLTFSHPDGRTLGRREILLAVADSGR